VQDKNNTLLACSELLTLLSLPIDLPIGTDYRLEIEEIKPTPEANLSALTLKEDLKIKKLQAAIAEQGVKSARGEKHPSVNFFGQFGSENPSSKSGFGQLERKSYWNAGLSLNFTLIDAGNTTGKILAAKAMLGKAKNEYEMAIEQTQLEIHQATLNLKTAQEIVTSQKENLKQAEETMRLAKVRYENGMFTQVEMFDAENAYLNANLAYLKAVFSHHQARVSYLLSTGKLGREFSLGI
jgi:outer membrane protein TolC